MKVALAFALVLGGVEAGGQAPLGLPAELATYRTWPAGEMHVLSVPADALCVLLSPRERAQRSRELEREQGVHAERFLRVYANAKASSVTPEATTFPVGSVIVKEKRSLDSAAPPHGVGVMIKHAEWERPLSAGWEFRYYPEMFGGSVQGCIDCHRLGGTKDYVFTRLPWR
jgi:hypothetical protein